MELTLNLVWLALTMLMMWAWLHYPAKADVEKRGAGRANVDWRVQFVALALVILILLPAISMTDDLMAARNPAEVETTCLRRDHALVHPHVLVPAVAALIVSLFSGLSLGPSRVVAAHSTVPPFVNEPLLSSINSRPPPQA